MASKRTIAIEWGILVGLFLVLIIVVIINWMRPPGPKFGEIPVLQQRVEQYQKNAPR